MSTFGRLLAWAFALILALLPVIALLQGWLASDRWPIEQLRITAEYRRVSEGQISAAVAPHAQAGFFAVDLVAVRSAVAALDWVAAVEVRKRWPNTLELVVEEHQPYALWGDDRLLSTRGRLFSLAADGAPSGLPRLQAEDRQVDEVVATYEASRPLFQAAGQELAGLRLSPRGSWSFQLGSGARLMAGRGDPLPRLARFLPHLGALQRVEGRLLQRADLRYANGFALRWATVEPAPQVTPTAVLAAPSKQNRRTT